MNIDFYLVIGIIIVCLILSFIYVKNTKEYFENHSVSSSEYTNDMAKELFAGENPMVEETEDQYPSDDLEPLSEDRINEIVAKASKKYCPVSSDYRASDYIRKSEMEIPSCPPQPDLKDFVLKSTIPPIQKCPSCVCPKVKLEAGLCKKCPEPKNNCPKPQPCGYEQCKNVIKCEPWQKQVHCPKCPEPKPCPQLPHQVCPAISLPKHNIKCPEPKACPLPTPCKDGDGRCPEKKCPSCTFKGVEAVEKEKSTEEMVNELLNSEDPKLIQLLERLKTKLNVSETETPPPLSLNNINAILDEKMAAHNVKAAPTTASTSMEIEFSDTKPNQNATNVYYKHGNNAPSPYDNSCESGQCAYNTELPI